MGRQNQPNEIYIRRTYRASAERVWNAWVVADQVAEWWGPRGFTHTTQRKEVKPGGDWLFTMHGPDGVDYPNYTKYFEVTPQKHLLYDHGGIEGKPPLFRVEVKFTESKGETLLDMTMTLPTPEAAENTKKHIKKMGGGTTWDRLAEFLEKSETKKEIFIINRSFDTDINTLFNAWTNPADIMKWLAPTGMTGRYIESDIRPGGQSFYEMSGNGITMYGKANYLELSKPNLLIYTQVFAHKDGKVSRHPMAPTFPETMKTTIRFYEEEPKQTRIEIQWEVFGNATKEEHDTFFAAKPGMSIGWTGSLDKLDEYLNSNSK